MGSCPTIAQTLEALWRAFRKMNLNYFPFLFIFVYCFIIMYCRHIINHHYCLLKDPYLISFFILILNYFKMKLHLFRTDWQFYPILKETADFSDFHCQCLRRERFKLTFLKFLQKCHAPLVATLGQLSSSLRVCHSEGQ